MKIASHGLAIGRYFVELFRPKEDVVAMSDHGHPILQDWEYSPEERLLQELEQCLKQRKCTPRMALFGCSGPHAGHVFFVTRTSEVIGPASQDDIVLTPALGASHGRFRASVGDEIELLSLDGVEFSLNGRSRLTAALVDYDELEIMGNRFIVLEIDGLRISPNLRTASTSSVGERNGSGR